VIGRIKKAIRALFPKRQDVFVQADDIGDLHNIRHWAKAPSKPLPKPNPGCEGKRS